MHVDLSDDVMDSLQLAAGKLTGFERRQFQAQMALKYCRWSSRQAE